ncbi:MAG: YjbH domain-containing protein, partial [Psychromonas sp.]
CYAELDNLPSLQSFTGAVLTPNAQVLTTGNASFLYGQGVYKDDQFYDLHNLLVSVGLFPGLEASGRIVVFDDFDGSSDLSASLKYQLPFIKHYTGFDLAFGVQDLGGEANNFKTYYAVTDYEFSAFPARISAGYGQSDLAYEILDGPFAAIEYQPFSFMQLVAEHDNSEVNFAVKAFTPKKLLPYDSQVSLQYQIASGHETNDEAMWSANLTVPILGYSDNNVSPKEKNLTQSIEDKILIKQSPHEISSVEMLKVALKKEGFVNLQIGTDNNTLLIALENRRYNHNEIDAIGVAMAIISNHAGATLFSELDLDTSAQKTKLIMLKNDIPVVAIETDMKCYREFILSGEACDSLLFTSLGINKTYQQTDWQSKKIASTFGRSQIILSPMIRHTMATEYGVYDYSLALGTNLYTSLWKGSAIDIRYVLPLTNSEDFDDGKLWGEDRYQSEIDTALFHQAFSLPFNIFNQTSIGYIKAGYVGVANESLWNSAQGYHSFGLDVNYFEPSDEDLNYRKLAYKETALGFYQLSLPQFNWQAKIQGGKFWNGDTGIKLSSMHWLGDVRIDATYQNTQMTQYSNSLPEEFVAINFSIPLTLWRGMKPGYVQFKG